MRWSSGTPGSSDKNAGSINSLSGNHTGNSIFAGLVFPSGGVEIAEDDIGDGQVTSRKLASDAVTADKLKDSTGTDSDRAVTRDHIRDGAINGAKLDADAVDGPKISGTATNFEVTQ